MHKTNLCKVGGSIPLTLPPAFLDRLHLKAGSKDGVSVDQACLGIHPISPTRYTLEALLAASDDSQPAAETEPKHSRLCPSQDAHRKIASLHDFNLLMPCAA